jgi:hypothetical protein
MHPPLRPVWAMVVVTLFIGCDLGTDVDDDGACPQTYEFGNTGCVEVRGRVLDEEGRPLAFSRVSPIPPTAPETGMWASGHFTPDSAGNFTVRLTRYVAPRPAIDPDTVSFYVRAFVIPIGVHAPPCPRDSVRVTVEVTPVGEVPTPATAELRLPRREADACRGY